MILAAHSYQVCALSLPIAGNKLFSRVSWEGGSERERDGRGREEREKERGGEVCHMGEERKKNHLGAEMKYTTVREAGSSAEWEQKGSPPGEGCSAAGLAKQTP